MVAMILFVATFLFNGVREEIYMKNVWKIVGVVLLIGGIGASVLWLTNLGENDDVQKQAEDEIVENVENNEKNNNNIEDADIVRESETDVRESVSDEKNEIIEAEVYYEINSGNEEEIIEVMPNNDTAVLLQNPNYIYNEEAMKVDTDGDGVPDVVENWYGLDSTQSDSDEDGLTDYEELNYTWTDPLSADTDRNGVPDIESDVDGDGIKYIDEISFNTNPLSADTDGDNLTDYEEIYTYNTIVHSIDSDEDGLSDYDEVVLNLNPLINDTDNDGILDADEKSEQVVEKIFEHGEGRGITKVNVSMNVAGNAQSNVNIFNMYETDMLSGNVRGLVGVPIEINSNMEFDSAKIKIYYDETMLGDVSEYSLGILWYDWENEIYQVIKSGINLYENWISFETTHFSTYMIIDSKEWSDAWRENVMYRSLAVGEDEQYLDIVFVVDCSSSMFGVKMDRAKTCLKNFVNSMQSRDEAAIICYEERAGVVCDFTRDTITLEKSIDKLFALGETNYMSGLLTALEVFSKRESNNRKIVVMISDGDGLYADKIVESYVEQNIPIYIIEVDNEFGNYAFERVSVATGGQHYYGKMRDTFEYNFALVQELTTERIDLTDNDDDGLYDIFETRGMKLANGQVIYTDPTKYDTDGDGLSDYQETGILYAADLYKIPGNFFVKDEEYDNIQYFMMISDPTKIDTDGDGLDDSIDDYCWTVDMKCVAKLSNIYSGTKYLKIEKGKNIYTYAGDQGWWSEMAGSSAPKNYWDFAMDKNYRLGKMGCGVIAVSDVEVYLMQQNPGYNSSINGITYDEQTGIIKKEEYMSYVNLASDLEYGFGGGIIYYNTGLMPSDMEAGLNRFLQMNNHEYTSVKWAPYSTFGKKEENWLVLEEIKSMLKKDLPVVFAYYTSDENNRITLYSDYEYAKDRAQKEDENKQQPKSHYMTIIGLYRYWEDEAMKYEYIMEVVSWGKIYYIRYDEYSDNMCYFSNILRIE